MRISIILVILFTIAAISAAFFISDQKDTEVLLVNVTLSKPPDNDSAKIISQVDAAISLVKRMEVPSDTLLSTPGITVLVLQDMQEKSGWNSVPIQANGSIYGNYTLMIKLSDRIDKKRHVKLLTRVVDPSGKDISVKASDVMLS